MLPREVRRGIGLVHPLRAGPYFVGLGFRVGFRHDGVAAGDPFAAPLPTHEPETCHEQGDETGSGRDGRTMSPIRLGKSVPGGCGSRFDRFVREVSPEVLRESTRALRVARR